MNKIIIKTKFDSYSKIINKLNNLKINIYDILVIENNLYITVTKEDYNKIKKYIISYKFVLHRNVGFKHFKSAIFLNKMFLGTIVFTSLLLLLFFNMIFDVEVLHENEYLRNILEKELTIAGIKPLSIKKDYEYISEVKENILNQYSDLIEWIEIETIGMKYVVKFEEKIISDNIQEENFCNVYAKTSGRITSIVIEKGVSAISIGDYVVKGDLLISGEIIYNNELKKEVCAKGEIIAEKWYETKVVVPYKYYELETTGVTRTNLILENANNKTKLLNDRLEEYSSETKLLFDLFGYQLYLEVQSEVYKKENVYTKEEAINKALELSLEKMNLKLNSKEKVISQKVLKNSEKNSTIEVEIFIVAEEIIN